MNDEDKKAIYENFKFIYAQFDKQADLEKDANKMFEDIYKRLERIEKELWKRN